MASAQASQAEMLQRAQDICSQAEERAAGAERRADRAEDRASKGRGRAQGQPAISAIYERDSLIKMRQSKAIGSEK